MDNNTTTEIDTLTNLYHKYEDRLSIKKAPEDNSLKKVVTFDDSKNSPIHRWFVFKEGYSKDLIKALEQREILPKESQKKILDPFCGVATTLLSTHTNEQNNHIESVTGIERNPAILSIAAAKLKWYLYNHESIKKMIEKVDKLPGRKKGYNYPIPSLSTFSKTRKSGKKAFDPEILQDLIFYREWIQNECENTIELDFFLLAWTSIIELASFTRKDGRALRLLSNDVKPNVKALFKKQCLLMLDDLIELNDKKDNATKIKTKVINGDARNLPFDNNSFTALCYSPPYLNNIDYSEVYKLELWLRGVVKDQKQFTSLRKGTFRSHPSIKFHDSSIINDFAPDSWIRKLKDAMILALPNDNFKEQRKSLFSGYIDDTILTLREQLRVSVLGAPIICIVGNSLHGSKKNPTVPVCTDLLISAAAQAVGLKIDHLQIARQLPRRDNKNGWLRETIIVMRKPNK